MRSTKYWTKRLILNEPAEAWSLSGEFGVIAEEAFYAKLKKITELRHERA